jgi:hypothetical protein
MFAPNSTRRMLLSPDRPPLRYSKPVFAERFSSRRNLALYSIHLSRGALHTPTSALKYCGALGSCVTKPTAQGRATSRYGCLKRVMPPDCYNSARIPRQLIAVDHLVVGKLDQLRAQLGNEIAINAFKEGKARFQTVQLLPRCIGNRPVGRQRQSPGRSIPRRSIFRRRVRRKRSVYGQGVKKARRDGRLGFRQL